MRAAPPNDVGKYLSLSMLLPIATFVGFGMGYGLDFLFHTGFLRWIFGGLGVAAGFISLVRELDNG